MRTYTQNEIRDLIECPKQFVRLPSTQFSAESGHLRLKFSLISLNGEESFSAYIRYNEFFEENFSVGLVHCPPNDNKATLVRCNGPHGEHLLWPHHLQCHIHLATAAAIAQGLKENGTIIPTSDYTTYREAIFFFLRYVNVAEPGTAFSWLRPNPSLPLFPNY